MCKTRCDLATKDQELHHLLIEHARLTQSVITVNAERERISRSFDMLFCLLVDSVTTHNNILIAELEELKQAQSQPQP